MQVSSGVYIYTLQAEKFYDSKNDIPKIIMTLEPTKKF